MDSLDCKLMRYDSLWPQCMSVYACFNRNILRRAPKDWLRNKTCFLSVLFPFAAFLLFPHLLHLSHSCSEAHSPCLDLTFPFPSIDLSKINIIPEFL